MHFLLIEKCSKNESTVTDHITANATMMLLYSCLRLVHNIFPCDVMRPEVQVNTYTQCKNRNKLYSCDAKRNYVILYAFPVASRFKPKYCEPFRSGH